MRAWHRLRFAQRHLLMSSLALSGRLITLTGRMSAYQAAVATDPCFIDLIQHDRLDHWRHGHLPLLTGEDKSAAYWLLARNRRTLYVRTYGCSRSSSRRHPICCALRRH